MRSRARELGSGALHVELAPALLLLERAQRILRALRISRAYRSVVGSDPSKGEAHNPFFAFFGMAREMHRAKVQKGAECTKPRVVCAPANSKQLAANRSSWSSWCSIL